MSNLYHGTDVVLIDVYTNVLFLPTNACLLGVLGNGCAPPLLNLGMLVVM